MSEIERILKKGVINDEFLKEEIRCGYSLNHKAKKIWAIELDLLYELDRVCKKYNLTYFLMCGSLLGAIRHKGFIPWDDDIDVGMFRKDLEKLAAVAEEEFTYPYFFQTPHTDPGSCFSMAKIRNSKTTAITESFRWEKFNQGMLLDIFTIDNVNMDVQEERGERIKQYTLNCSAYMRRNNPNLNEHDLMILRNYNGIDPIENYDNLQSLCSEFNNIETEYVGARIFTLYPWQKLTYRRENFASIEWVDFENTKAPIPIGYEDILKTNYGNYMQLPPIKERGVWHTKTTFYDPDKSYLEYIKN